MARVPTFQRTYFPNDANTAINPERMTNQAIMGIGGQSMRQGEIGLQKEKDARDTTWLAKTSSAWESQQDRIAEDFRRENALNPDGKSSDWNQKLIETRDGILETAPSQEARMAFLRSSENYIQRNAGQMREWETVQKVGNFATSVDEAANNLYNSAFFRGNLAEMDTLLNKGDTLVVAGSTFMAPDKLEEMRKKVRSNIALSTANGMMEKAPSQLKKALNDGRFDGVLESGQVQSLYKQATAAERAAKERAKAAAAEKLANAGFSIDNAIDRMKSGYTLPKEELEAIDGTIAQIGDAGISKKWQAAKELQTTVSYYQKLPPLALNDIVNDLYARTREDGASASEVMQLEVAQGILKTKSDMAQKDPMTLAAQTGEAVITPLQFSTDETGQFSADAIASFKNRAMTAQAVAQRYGTKPNPFTQEEQRSLTTAMELMTPDEKVSFTNQLVNSMGPVAPFAREIIAKSDPVLGHAAGLYGFNEQGAYQIMRGQQLIKNNPSLAPKAAEADSVFKDTVGNLANATPEYLGGIREAATAIYADMVGRNAKPGSDFTFDEDKFKKAINIAVGADPDDIENTGIVEIGAGWSDGIMKNTIILPPKVSKPNFEKYLTKLTQWPDEFRKASLGGKTPTDFKGNPVPMQSILEEGVLEQRGNGMYAVLMPDGNYLRGAGPSGEYILQANPQQIFNLLNTPEVVAPKKEGLSGLTGEFIRLTNPLLYRESNQ